MLPLRLEDCLHVTGLAQVPQGGIPPVHTKFRDHYRHMGEAKAALMQPGEKLAIHHIVEVLPQAVARIQHAGPAEEAGGGTDVAVMVDIYERRPARSLDTAKKVPALVHETVVPIDDIRRALTGGLFDPGEGSGLQAIIRIQPHHPSAAGAVEALVNGIRHPLVLPLGPNDLRKALHDHLAVISRTAIDHNVLHAYPLLGSNAGKAVTEEAAVIQIRGDDREVHFYPHAVHPTLAEGCFPLPALAFFPFACGVPRPAAICSFIFATLILSALTWTVWQYRFIAAPGVPAMDLTYLPPEVTKETEGMGEENEGFLRMTAAEEVPRILLKWTTPPAAKYAHFSVSASLENLKRGGMPWEDGRVLLIWMDPAGTPAKGHLPLWAGHCSSPSDPSDMIVPLQRAGAFPCFIIENRAKSGSFLLKSMVVQPLKQRPWVPAAVILLICGWTGLIWSGLRATCSGHPVRWPRYACAAALWVAAAWFSSLPGPFVPWRPVFQSFPISKIAPPQAKDEPPPATVPAPTVAALPASQPQPAAPPSQDPARPPAQAAGKSGPNAQTAQTPVNRTAERMRGEFTSWIFGTVPMLKRPIHILGFAALTFLFCMLAGNASAARVALALGGLTEFMQWAYGFGFDAGDVADLVFDTLAVIAGVVFWRWSGRILARLRPRSAPAAAAKA